MKKCHKIILSSLLFVMLFMLSLTSNITFTYWSNIDLNDTNNSTVTVGQWSLAPNGISLYDSQATYTTGDLVWFNDEIWEYHGVSTQGTEPSVAANWTILNDLNWYATVTYRNGDVVLYNNHIYVTSTETTNEDPELTGLNGPWVIQTSDAYVWQVGQTVVLNEVVYHNGSLWIYKGISTTSEPGTQNDWALYGDLLFSINYTYADGDYVEYNGSYYLVANGAGATGTIPGSNGSWTQLTVPAFNGSVPNNSTYTTYNGLFYVALQGKVNGGDRSIVPGSLESFGIWQALNTQEWQQYNTYVNGDLVMYQSNVYQLANSVNSTNTPGTTTDSWNGLRTVDYDPSFTYSIGDYVLYNSEIYVVVNEINANSSAPGTITNAWNQISGYDWYSFNVYEINDVVFYNNAVYKAIQQTTNEQPDLTPGSWTLYQTT